MNEKKKKLSALSKIVVDIPAYSVYTVDYMDSKPNYFRVQNNGAVNLYASTSHTPTQNRFDFMIPAAGIKMFAEPIPRTRLYIFNPSGSDVHAVVLSFEAEFDPLTLALSEIDLDLSGTTLETSSVISGFNSALPKGYNMIGYVGLNSALPEGENHIGEVSLAGGAVSLADDQLETLLGKRRGVQTVIAHNGEVATETRYNVTYINFITNDHETNDVTVMINTQSLTLKAGETLQDVELNGDTVSISGASFRALILKY